MKKISIMFTLLCGFAIINVQAQCQKSKASCCKSKATVSEVESRSCCIDASTAKDKLACLKKCQAAGLPCSYGAAHFASLDESIEELKSTSNGELSYFKKNTCHFSGNVSLTKVEFDISNGKFVNVSPDFAEKMKNCKMVCSPKEIAKCKAMGIKCGTSHSSLASNEGSGVRP